MFIEQISSKTLFWRVMHFNYDLSEIAGLIEKLEEQVKRLEQTEKEETN